MTEATRIHLPQGFVPAGTRLSGIYEIDSPLAKGGMGEVYRGHAIETGDPVAIKLIRADMADNEAALALFRREASALNRLHHEAIVRYFVFSLDPGLQRHYLAMELVQGVSLSELITRGPLTVADTHGLMRRVASGLQAAHERGIVHRDVSPDNVIIEDGDVAHARIIDFGIARSTRVGDATVIGGGFAGKYNYVSPEQLGLFGGEVTGKSDIYSLALVLVQCLRGKPLDMGGSQADIIDKRRKVPDLADVDSRLRPLLSRMLQPDPADRPASMAELVATPLVAGRGSAGTAARPAPARSRADAVEEGSRNGASKWAIATIAGVFLLGAAGFVGYLQFGDRWTFETPVVTPRLDGPSPNLTPPADTPPADAPPTAPGSPRVEPVTIPTPPPAGPITMTDRMAKYLRDYDGGECFLALPTSLSDTSAEIDAFAANPEPFNVLDESFRKSIGFEAMIDGAQVTQAQCAALGFARRLRAQANAAAARLDIGKTRVKGSEALEGTVRTGAANVALLVVDEEGLVHDVSAQLTGSVPLRAFAMKFQKPPGARVQPTLLMAVASAHPLAALKPAGGSARTEVFTAALREAEAQGGSVEVAVKYFKIE